MEFDSERASPMRRVAGTNVTSRRRFLCARVPAFLPSVVRRPVAYVAQCRVASRRVASGGRDEIDDDIRVGSREVVNAERRNVVWVFSVKAVRTWRRSRGKDGKVDARVATKSANGVV